MIIIDKDLCVGCGRCEPFCPSEALRAWGYLQVDAEKCNDCLSCIEACPLDAISEA